MEAKSEDELRRQILNFLNEFKALMGEGNYFIKNHLKNVETLKNLGMTSRMRDEFILSLASQNYSSGPHVDQIHTGCYWIFGKPLDETEIYIKLKIITSNNGTDKAVCISFHPSEFPLKYPYQQINRK